LGHTLFSFITPSSSPFKFFSLPNHGKEKGKIGSRSGTNINPSKSPNPQLGGKRVQVKKL